jgi:hypothetical protein
MLSDSPAADISTFVWSRKVGEIKQSREFCELQTIKLRVPGGEPVSLLVLHLLSAWLSGVHSLVTRQCDQGFTFLYEIHTSTTYSPQITITIALFLYFFYFFVAVSLVYTGSSFQSYWDLCLYPYFTIGQPESNAYVLELP